MHRIQVVRAKLHGLTVTDANLEYQGSITLDPLHCEAVGIYPLEFVDIWNRNSGARLSTYVIFGEPGSGCCILIGPEGDFSPAEIQAAFGHGVRPVTLGDARLRTERAALAAAHTVHVVRALAG